jgi:hypothetical protein
MARLLRMVIPDVPHHITQRGNRRERTFFEDGDYALFVDVQDKPTGVTCLTRHQKKGEQSGTDLRLIRPRAGRRGLPPAGGRSR